MPRAVSHIRVIHISELVTSVSRIYKVEWFKVESYYYIVLIQYT